MAEFCPLSLSEEPTPSHLKDCQDCGLYEHGTRMVWGEGNPNAPILVLLDNPGAREDREGNPFVCGTRQTFQQTAIDAGLKIDDLFITFILKRKPVARTIKSRHVKFVCNIWNNNYKKKILPLFFV